MEDLFIDPIVYYEDCCGCIFRKKCKQKWKDDVPYHIDNEGKCPDEFEFNKNELYEKEI